MRDTKDERKMLYELNEQVKKMAANMERVQIADYVRLMNKPWKLIALNLMTGTARGVGIAIGFTFFASSIIYLLQLLGGLDIPIIGNYITEIVRHVQSQLEKRGY